MNRFSLLGININPLLHKQILTLIALWIKTRSLGNRIVVANTHVIMECRQNSLVSEAVNTATLVIPDGMPLVVLSRWRGFPLRERADGPGLMTIALNQEPYKSWRHYFYGSTPEVLSVLRARYPDTRIVGQSAPPFRQLTPEEDAYEISQINSAAPDILWIGLGCPKQEIWMYEHQKKLNVPVMVGVGQAFDILAGVKPRAPRWMQNAGLEWLYRLIHEPHRLWKRYLIYNPWFIWLVLKEQLHRFFKGALD